MTSDSAMSFPDELLNLAEEWSPVFKLLGDPTRMRLLLAMHHHGSAKPSVGELAELTDLRTATASAALTLMATAGIITAEKRGRVVHYSLTDPHVHELLHYVGGTHATGNGDSHH